MDKKKIDIPLENPNFLQVVFAAWGGRAEISGIQEGCSVRNMLIVRDLSNRLLDEEGHFNGAVLPAVTREFEKKMYSLGPGQEHDAKRNEHILKILKLLEGNKRIVQSLMRVGKPSAHRIGDQIIRNTLLLPQKTIITDAHARRAALSALLSYLRQTIGSCFATAPAIMIQSEQPEFFLNDIQELLTTGRLKRTFGGIEYAVPLSGSSGAGDLKKMAENTIWSSPGILAALDGFDKNINFIGLTIEEVIQKVLQAHFQVNEREINEYQERPKGAMQGSLLMHAPVLSSKVERYLEQLELSKNAFKSVSENALLKSWEFSLASFAEIKANFTRWNLYSSLGLGPHEEGGIGPCLIEILEEKLRVANERLKEHQAEYEIIYQQLQFFQSKLRSAASEKEMQWTRIEYQTKMNEFRLQEELRNKFHRKAERYANLFDQLIGLYDKLFPRYYQEVYDPDIHEVTVGPYDDSPAGFRLVYKHGRTNTSQWTKIENHIDFIDSLTNFFTATETEIANLSEMKGLEEDVSEITTAIVSHIRSKRFIETAFNRMAIAHRSKIVEDPLENLDKIEKKPWVYTSGGSLDTLINCYFRRNEKLTEVSRWVENPMELLMFYVDSIKAMPEKSLEILEAGPEKSLLACSPTHAFLLKPGYNPFASAWRNKEFTYTWIRDNLVKNMEQFCKKMYLDDEKMGFVLDLLKEKIPPEYRQHFNETFGSLGGSMNVKDFRDYILLEQALLSAECIDATLFNILPLHPTYKLKEIVQALLTEIPDINLDDAMHHFDLYSSKILTRKVVSSKEIINIIKALIILSKGGIAFPVDYHKLIVAAAQRLGYALPTPIIFADTNWIQDYFAFVVNPGTCQLELWRTDYTGITGAPMHLWEKWLDGSVRDPKWGLFTNFFEYQL